MTSGDAGPAGRSARIGRYWLGQIIGRGGSSVVYRAESQWSQSASDPHSVVAVKVAHSDYPGESTFRRQFLDHARAAAMVDHSGVLPVVDSGQDGGRPFLVMPHVRGADLAHRLQARSLPLGRVLTLLREVAEALDALHAGGVLHLDVKPSNVLVGRREVLPGTREDTVDRAFLADLGLCRFLADPSPGASGGELRADFVGSPRYASPEHLRGRAVRASSDIYSLSCVLFAALAGRPPYTGDIPAVVTGHLSGVVPSLSSLAGVPRRLDLVIRRGMHPDPGSRFASCRDLLASAVAALGSGPAPA